MRKITIALLLVISLSASAQKKDSVPEVTDSTALISISDYQHFVNELVQELPAKYADVIRQWWIQRFQMRAQEFIKPKKK